MPHGNKRHILLTSLYLCVFLVTFPFSWHHFMIFHRLKHLILQFIFSKNFKMLKLKGEKKTKRFIEMLCLILLTVVNRCELLPHQCKIPAVQPFCALHAAFRFYYDCKNTRIYFNVILNALLLWIMFTCKASPEIKVNKHSKERVGTTY